MVDGRWYCMMMMMAMAVVVLETLQLLEWWRGSLVRFFEARWNLGMHVA